MSSVTAVWSTSPENIVPNPRAITLWLRGSDTHKSKVTKNEADVATCQTRGQK